MPEVSQSAGDSFAGCADAFPDLFMGEEKPNFGTTYGLPAACTPAQQQLRQPRRCGRRETDDPQSLAGPCVLLTQFTHHVLACGVVTQDEIEKILTLQQRDAA